MKRAEVVNVVTRGLDPDVPMKDSGIPWIGMIPSHWEVKPMSSMLQKCNLPSSQEDVKIGLENIESWRGKYVKTVTEYDGRGPHFEKGTILYGKLRPYLAKVWIAEFSGQAVGDFYVFMTKTKVEAEYIKYSLLNPKIVYLLDSFTYGAKMPRVSWNDMSRVYLPLPPLAEQQAIVEYINGKTARIDALIAELRAEINYLAEYRQRLIADVVTGQINVQNQ